jgi:hypothetical protein
VSAVVEHNVAGLVGCVSDVLEQSDWPGKM